MTKFIRNTTVHMSPSQFDSFFDNGYSMNRKNTQPLEVSNMIKQVNSIKEIIVDGKKIVIHER